VWVNVAVVLGVAVTVVCLPSAVIGLWLEYKLPADESLTTESALPEENAGQS
jgi:hypothetical protein